MQLIILGFSILFAIILAVRVTVFVSTNNSDSRKLNKLHSCLLVKVIKTRCE